MITNNVGETEIQSNHQQLIGPIEIGLMSPFGHSNLGDLATQQAMIQNIKKYYPDAQIYGFSLHPEDTEKRYGIPSFPITRLGETDEWWLGKQPGHLTIALYKTVQNLRHISNPVIKKLMSPWLILTVLLLELSATVRAYRHLNRLDLLIVSGGGQLDDYWWGARFHPYTLFLWANLARLRRVKFAFVSVGAGPIDAKLSKLFIRYALSTACYRSYRDEDSKKYIERVLNFKQDDPIYPDLAHSLPIDKYRNSSTPQKDQLTIGINPMSSYFDRHDDSAYSIYLNKLALFVAWLIQKQHKILFFPGCIEGDVPAIKDLRTILENNGVVYEEGQIIEETIQTVDDQVAQL
jgi:polysaccharide pyruvyl transferase WcaK-like protein